MTVDVEAWSGFDAESWRSRIRIPSVDDVRSRVEELVSFDHGPEYPREHPPGYAVLLTTSNRDETLASSEDWAEWWSAHPNADDWERDRWGGGSA